MLTFDIRWNIRAALLVAAWVSIASAEPLPRIAMMPPAAPGGQSYRDLFTKPDQWSETRSKINVLGYADHMLNKQFTDDELRAWLPMIGKWNLKLELEIGSIKPWGTNAVSSFAHGRKMWDRFQSLGGKIDILSMDEPLCCTRKDLKQPDAYAVEETAKFIALVRTNYPDIQIGDIEPYPFIPLADQIAWVDALQKRLAEMNVRGLDFYRLDVNWAEFVVFDRGNWPEVRKLERHCREKKLPFSLIYWASGYPGLAKRGLADDSTWYVSIMQQGYDYALAEGRPDQYVIESWIGAPSRALPETGDWTFTRSVRDFCERFVKEKK